MSLRGLSASSVWGRNPDFICRQITVVRALWPGGHTESILLSSACPSPARGLYAEGVQRGSTGTPDLPPAGKSQSTPASQHLTGWNSPLPSHPCPYALPDAFSSCCSLYESFDVWVFFLSLERLASLSNTPQPHSGQI